MCMKRFFYNFIYTFAVMVFFALTVTPMVKWMKGDWDSWVLYSYFITIPAWIAAVITWDNK